MIAFRGPKVLGSMGRYRKISSYRNEILYIDYLGPRNMPAKFQLSRPKIGELWAPKFGVM